MLIAQKYLNNKFISASTCEIVSLSGDFYKVAVDSNCANQHECSIKLDLQNSRMTILNIAFEQQNIEMIVHFESGSNQIQQSCHTSWSIKLLKKFISSHTCKLLKAQVKGRYEHSGVGSSLLIYMQRYMQKLWQRRTQGCQSLC